MTVERVRWTEMLGRFVSSPAHFDSIDDVIKLDQYNSKLFTPKPRINSGNHDPGRQESFCYAIGIESEQLNAS